MTMTTSTAVENTFECFKSLDTVCHSHGSNQYLNCMKMLCIVIIIILLSMRILLVFWCEHKFPYLQCITRAYGNCIGIDTGFASYIVTLADRWQSNSFRLSLPPWRLLALRVRCLRKSCAFAGDYYSSSSHVLHAHFLLSCRLILNEHIPLCNHRMRWFFFQFFDFHFIFFFLQL